MDINAEEIALETLRSYLAMAVEAQAKGRASQKLNSKHIERRRADLEESLETRVELTKCLKEFSEIIAELKQAIEELEERGANAGK